MRPIYLTCVLPVLLFCQTGCRVADPDPVEPVNHILDFDKALKSTSKIMLSSVASELEFIPIETNDSLLLDEYLKVNIQPGHIIVWSRTTEPVLFDRKGRFISRIGRYGKGPKEIIPDAVGQMSSFIDEASEKVTLNAQGKQYSYAWDGTLISIGNITENLKKIVTDSTHIAMADAGRFYLFNRGLSFIANMNGNIYTSEDGGMNFKKVQMEKQLSSSTLTIKANSVSILKRPSANILNDNVAYFDYESGAYTHFFYDGTVTTPYLFKFDQGFKSLNSKSHVYQLDDLKKYLFININRHRFIYDKQNDALTAIEPWPEEELDEEEDEEDDYEGRGYLVNDIEPAFEFRISGVTAEGDLYDLMSAVRFRAEAERCNNPKLKRMAEQMKDDDNQVIVIAKMKK